MGIYMWYVWILECLYFHMLIMIDVKLTPVVCVGPPTYMFLYVDYDLMQTHSGSLKQLGLWPKVWVDPKTQNKSEEPHTFWEELSCTRYTFGDKSRFGEQEQRVAQFLEMTFLERNTKQGVRSRFLPRFVETSWILAWNLHLSFILCQACTDICSYVYSCGFWGIQTSHYVNSWSFNIWF